MRTSVVTVTPGMSVAQLVEDAVMQSDQHSFPVVANGQIAGVVSLSDVRRAPRSHWPELSVAEIMTAAADALGELAEHDQVPVVQGDRLLDIVRRQDIVKWLSLSEQHAV